MLAVSIVSMCSALACYSTGVWGEKLAGILKLNHLVFFWVGFVCDTLGTTLMGRMAGVFTMNVHGVTGLAAIVLMAGHAVWASIVLSKNHEKLMRIFHRFSLAVWAIWLVPFISGMLMAMAR